MSLYQLPLPIARDFLAAKKSVGEGRTSITITVGNSMY